MELPKNIFGRYYGEYYFWGNMSDVKPFKQFPTKLPVEVIEAIEKAVAQKKFRSKNQVVVKTLAKGLGVKLKPRY